MSTAIETTPLLITETHKNLVREILAQRLDPAGPPFVEQSALLIAQHEAGATAELNRECEHLARRVAETEQVAEGWKVQFQGRDADWQHARQACDALRAQVWTLRALLRRALPSVPKAMASEVGNAITNMAADYQGHILLTPAEVARVKELAGTPTLSTDASNEILALLAGKVGT